MKFRNRSDYSGHIREVRTFPFFKSDYMYDVDKKTGEKFLVKIGEVNVYEQKQEALQDTLIYNLIDRINRTGDYSLLGETLDGFIDTLDYPKTLMEAENLRLRVQNFFDSLPIADRQKYGNNVSLFLTDINKQLLNKSAAPAAPAAPADAAASEV